MSVFRLKNGLRNSRNCRNYEKKLREQNPPVSGAANREPRMGEGRLYMTLATYSDPKKLRIQPLVSFRLL